MNTSNSKLSHGVAYCRCATQGQASLSKQRHQARVEAAKRGDTIGEFFEDTAANGNVIDHIQLQRLREAVKGGQVNRLYVASLDRLTRCPSKLSLLLQEFADSGVSVIVPGDTASKPFITIPTAEINLALLRQGTKGHSNLLNALTNSND